MTAPFVLPGNSPARLWPLPEEEPVAPPRLLAAITAVALLGAATIRLDAFGSAVLLTGSAVLVLAMACRRRRPTTGDLVTAAAALALLSVATVRSAPWLVVLCLLGAWALATLALVGGRTWTGVVIAAVASVLATSRALVWTVVPLKRVRIPATKRGTAVALVSGCLLFLFGSLFAAADPAYAHVLDALAPALDAAPLVRRGFVLLAVGGTATLAVFLAQRPPAVDALAPAPATPVRRTDWLVPLASVDALFLSFVSVQLSVLFGGRDHVLRSTGLSYAEYARHGFWQLLVVTGLTLVVIAGAVRFAPRESGPDRLLVRLLLGGLCLLSLVVVASALHRMSLYEDAYGFTRLRLFVQAVELALGAVFVLLLVAGVRLDGRWLPRAVVGVAAVTLVGLAVVDPDASIARHNVERYQRSGQIDTSYLSTLSADAVPELLRLPLGLRACAVNRIRFDLRDTTDPWWDVNRGRRSARAPLAHTPVGTCRAG
jgi:hypothetical protein